MARKAKETTGGFDLSGAVVLDKLATKEREHKPNPLIDLFSQSAHSGQPLGFPYDGTEDTAKELEGYIRRAAADRDLGSKVRTSVDENGTPRFEFQAIKKTIRNQRYTVDDIRAWLGADAKYKVTPEERAMYRKEHGLDDRK
jgi:hypothetical protein